MATYSLSDSFIQLKGGEKKNAQKPDTKPITKKVELEESLELMVKEESGSDTDSSQLIKTPGK